MKFSFFASPAILFGVGTRFEALDRFSTLGRRPFVVTGGPKPEAESFLEKLRENSPASVFYRVSSGEPSIPGVNEALRAAKTHGCDSVIAVGGGSVIDTGKAVSALLTNGDDCLEFLEVIGQGKPLARQPVPMVALPTTAGTGTEVTKNAVLASPEHQVKVSMRSEMMIPRVAVVDPELCLSMPAFVTAHTGLDALTQLMEAFVSRKKNPLTDGICREGIRRASRSLIRAFDDGSDIDARTDMSCASLFGGLALANAGLGAVHGFAGPMGGMYHQPHGLLCAVLLPHVFAANAEAASAQSDTSELSERFVELAGLLTGSDSAAPERAIAWIRSTCEKLNIPRLSDLDIPQADFPEIVRKALGSSSMKGNPLELSERELLDILERAY